MSGVHAPSLSNLTSPVAPILASLMTDDHYILDYKGRYCLADCRKFADRGDFDQYAVGNYGIGGQSRGRIWDAGGR